MTNPVRLQVQVATVCRVAQTQVHLGDRRAKGRRVFRDAEKGLRLTRPGREEACKQIQLAKNQYK